MQVPSPFAVGLARLKRLLRRPVFVPMVVLTLVVIAIWSVTLWEIRGGRTRALTEEAAKNASLAQLQEERVLRSLQVLDQALLVLRHDFSQPHLHENFEDRIRTMQLDADAITAVSIVDARGEMVLTTAKRNGASFSDRDYFKQHAGEPEDRLLVGRPIVGRMTNAWVIPLTRRISKPDGSFGGVIYMSVNPGYLMTEAAPSGLGLTSTFALVGLDGFIRLRNKGGVLSYGDDVHASRIFKELANAPNGYFVDVALYDGKTRITSYRTVEGYPLVVAVGSDFADVIGERKKTEGIYIGLALLCSGLVVLLGVVVNSAWVRVEIALENARASERKFRFIFDASPVPMAINDDTFHVTHLNAAFVQAFGYTHDDVPTLESWWPLAYPDPGYREQVKNRWNDELGRSAMTAAPFNPLDIEIRCKDGSVKYVMVGATALSESMLGEHLVVLYDITHLKSVQDDLRTLVLEKNALLREVHHRVKNNLQVITSLLRLEGARTGQANVKAVLTDMQWRIRSMALLHESLYRSDNFESVRLDSYIKQIATEVFRAGSEHNSRISLVLELQPVTVSMNQAPPCGLIVNELIANALKHGLADGRIGMLKISLQAPDAQGLITLRVCDNGVGLPADFEARQAESLGMQLVSDLVMQLRGALAVGPAPEAAFAITFKPEVDGAA